MERICGEARAIAGAANYEAESMPTATALRCFIAALEEPSEDGKPVGGADTGQRIMARPNRVPFVSLPHLL